MSYMECVSRPSERSQMDMQKPACSLVKWWNISVRQQLVIRLGLAPLWGRTPLFHSLSDALCTGFICAIHREPQRPKGASSPDFISHTHLQALSRVTSPARLAEAAGAAESGNIWHQKPIQYDTIRVRGQKEGSFFSLSFFPQIKPLQDSVWPCGLDMRITSRQACNACVIRQSGGVHTHSWRIKGSQGQISSPHVCAEYEACAENTCAPPGHTGGENCACGSLRGVWRKKKSGIMQRFTWWTLEY